MNPPRMSRDILLNNVAQTFAIRGTCTRAAVGAVLSRDGRILSTGYNGAPAGLPHCSHECRCMSVTLLDENGKPTSDPELQRGAGHDFRCPAVDKGCKIAVHAEANAVAFAAKHGVPTDMTELHTTMAPCYVCAQLIINAGIIRVMFVRSYRDMSGVDLLKSANVEVVQA